VSFWCRESRLARRGAGIENWTNPALEIRKWKSQIGRYILKMRSNLRFPLSDFQCRIRPIFNPWSASFIKQLRHFVTALSATCVLMASVLSASDHQGLVRIGEVPVPGASIKATQGDKTTQAVTNAEGRYVLQDLSDGLWTVQVEMLGFEPARREITVAKENAVELWELKMLPLDNIDREPVTGFPNSASPGTPTLRIPVSEVEAQDRLLINGSVSNGASTPFALKRAFGNVRAPRTPYRGTLSINGNNSLLDARPFSLTGQDTPQPDYNRLQTSISINGPLQIPHVFRMGTFTAGYTRTQYRNAAVQTARMPTAAERVGDFSGRPATVVDPATGLPFTDNVIPSDRISPQALALLPLYPFPNFDGSMRYNYQVPVVGVTHGDAVQVSINNIRLGRSDTLSGNGTYSNTRSDNPDMFGFTDANRATATSVGVAWVHRFNPRVSGNIRYSFTRGVTRILPYFGTRVDVSGDAGITGGDTDPRNWGPPGLNFSGGMARLSTGSHTFDRNQLSTLSYSSTWIRGRHNFGYGVEYRRQQFNLLSQQDGRGNFTFTGAASGNDFADFLLGVPTASSLALGNADKYFRQSLTDAYLNDDFRVIANLSLKVGVRWEYESPITEKYGRLVNLDIPPDFSSATPVIAGSSTDSLVIPDKSGFEPRVALAWRPRAASSMVIRAGYGIYRDTSVYRAIADQMAQQSPLSKSLSVQNTPENPLTLADGFRGSPSVSATTFAIDPHFRPGYAQNWQLSVQQDLPLSMQITATYLGIKGTHVPQRILPNTFPEGVVNPCPGCPTGFVYLASTGNTNRHSGSIEVRRRQRNGFEASAAYTYAKAIDDAGLGGANVIAQNWLNRRAERGLSNFDQRHLLTVQGMYSTGTLAGIGSFWDNWAGALLKQWTLTGQLAVGTGLPLTPVILAPVNGTGVSGSLRPNVTGAPIYLTDRNSHLNPIAFAKPAVGEWGNAARNSITGPKQFSLNASLTRSFTFSERVGLDLRIEAMNVLNHVTFPNWNTTVNSSQFGLPTRANAMRTIQPSIRMRF
jgi:trimeric autotransporter adhesin